MMDHKRLPAIVLTGDCSPEEASEMATILLEAKARRSDPDTSQEAAQSVLAMTDRRTAVLEMFSSCGPMTDEELLRRYRDDLPPQSASGLRTRRSELVRMGELMDTGKRRRMTTGRMAIVWAQVEAANPLAGWEA